MGLDTTHDCWHGAYSSFSRWREVIFRAAGLPPLHLMENFWKEPSEFGLDPFSKALKNSKSEDDRKWLEQEYLSSLPISWDALKPSALYLVINHSDCDGYLATDDCGDIADALEELLPALAEETQEAWGHIGDWVVKTQQFIRGLRSAHSLGEDVEFH